jgi:hypothetical protein
MCGNTADMMQRRICPPSLRGVVLGPTNQRLLVFVSCYIFCCTITQAAKWTNARLVREIDRCKIDGRVSGAKGLIVDTRGDE